jgi:hypothetical protein
MGFVMQWARAVKGIPNWLSYLVLGLATVAIYWWMTPDALDIWHTNWRLFVAQLVSFFLAARGGASIAKDSKAAPATDSM